MKLSFTLIILIILGIGISNGQTNTFPTTGSVGIGTLSPSSFFHGGNNRVLEIFNPNNTLNSQSHVILSTGSTLNNSGAGTLSWISRNSTGFKGMAYVGSTTQGDASINSSANLVFATSNGSAVYPRMVIDKDGNVGIGTINPNEMLSVKGKIRAQEIKVETSGWPDYVFAKDYQLPSLQETDRHIKDKGHLPGIPSAEEVKCNGIDLGEMNAKLLKKIEELTLYLIDMKKEKEQEKLEKTQLQQAVKDLDGRVKSLIENSRK
jgi:hypothetical protein